MFFVFSVPRGTLLANVGLTLFFDTVDSIFIFTSVLRADVASIKDLLTAKNDFLFSAGK